MKQSTALGTNFIQFSAEKPTTIVFLRPIMPRLLPCKTHSTTRKPRRPLVIMPTMGFRLIKGDSGKSHYKQGCSPKPTDGSTSSFPRVKDRPDKHNQLQGCQKWREQGKRGEDEDIVKWTKREAKAVSSRRGSGFLSETASQLTSSRLGKPRNS